MTHQDRRDVILKLLLEYRVLVQDETLADGTTHEAFELKQMSDACGSKLGDILQIFDNMIERMPGFSPGVQRAIKEWEARDEI